MIILGKLVVSGSYGEEDGKVSTSYGMYLGKDLNGKWKLVGTKVKLDK